MCGVAGFLIDQPFSHVGKFQDILCKMTDALAHRGPDADGAWLDPARGVALGHRRLSILDLSAAGAQPMLSQNDRYIIVFNGEIYNHLTLRKELAEEGISGNWRGSSDTETLLEGLSHWGIKETMCRAFGMFACAVWDRKADRLTLIRDRMGEKPLYFGRTEDGWVFGSELKAFFPSPGFKPLLDTEAINEYLAYGYVPEGYCIFKGVNKLAPGCFVEITAGASEPTVRPYQPFSDLAFADKTITENADTIDFSAQSRSLAELLDHVVSEQMLSDVPLGCFLSGGVDSSLIASLMQARSKTQVRTFSIGFSEERFNEAPHAARVAAHLGTAHNEFILSEQDALNAVMELQDVYDEPFADSSQIPTVLLCHEARKFVTVALTGDGADEVFGGYNRHVLGPTIWKNASLVPSWIRKPAGRLFGQWDRLSVEQDSFLRRLAKKIALPTTAIDKGAQLARALSQADSVEDLYMFFVRVFPDGRDFPTEGGPPQMHGKPPKIDAMSRLSSAEWMMAMDSTGYLPGDILVKVDRAAMNASLETRAPFLDARIVRRAWELPLASRINGRTGKVVLRDILYQHVPQDLVDRPKQGFAVPIDRWLRGALAEWAGALLLRQDLTSLAGLDREKIDKLWDAHQTKRANNSQQLWTILMLLAWLEKFLSESAKHSLPLDETRNQAGS